MLPNLAQGVATLLSPPITIPGIPGFGIPLPKTISTPHSLLCIGAVVGPGSRWIPAFWRSGRTGAAGDRSRYPGQPLVRKLGPAN